MRSFAIVGFITAFSLAFAFSGRAADSKATSRPASAPASQPASKPATTQPSKRVVIETNLGRIVLELTPEKTPITVENFLRYVDARHYDNTIFHRVIQGFMIQGGGLGQDLREKKTKDPIKNESEKAIKNRRGAIAMARKPNPDSATAQFFINLVDNNRLDYPNYGGYTAFGTVVEGMDVVDKIAEVPVKQSGVSEAQPVELVLIKSIRRAAD